MPYAHSLKIFIQAEIFPLFSIIKKKKTFANKNKKKSSKIQLYYFYFSHIIWKLFLFLKLKIWNYRILFITKKKTLLIFSIIKFWLYYILILDIKHLHLHLYDLYVFENYKTRFFDIINSISQFCINKSINFIFFIIILNFLAIFFYILPFVFCLKSKIIGWLTHIRYIKRKKKY